jgi:hypothetical protein
MRMSRERPPEEEQRPASVNGDEEDLAARPKPKLRRPPEVRKDPASGSSGRCAGVSEPVHGPRVCQRTFFPVIDIIVSSLSLGQYLHSPSGTTSPLPDLTDEDVITPAAKPPGEPTPAPRKVQKGSKRAAATSRTQGDAPRRPSGQEKASGY